MRKQCGCGYATHPTRECVCSPLQVRRYLGRVSGPLMDRIDLRVKVPALRHDEPAGGALGERSAAVRKRVMKTREIQAEPFKSKGVFTNTCMSAAATNDYRTATRDADGLLKQAMEKLSLSAVAYDRILRFARTIADLEEGGIIEPQHMAEVLQYRRPDRER